MKYLHDPAVRRAIYQVLLAIGAILAVFGVGTMETYETVASKLMDILPAVLLILGNILAVKNTPAQEEGGAHRAD